MRKLVIFQFLKKLWVFFFIRRKFAGYNPQMFTSVKMVNGLVLVPTHFLDRRRQTFNLEHNENVFDVCIFTTFKGKKTKLFSFSVF